MLCPFCHRAKRTLDELDLAYEVIEVTFSRKRWREMKERSNRTTVPQIFIDGHHIGGSDDLEIARANGTLKDLLNRSSQAPQARR